MSPEGRPSERGSSDKARGSGKPSGNRTSSGRSSGGRPGATSGGKPSGGRPSSGRSSTGGTGSVRPAGGKPGAKSGSGRPAGGKPGAKSGTRPPSGGGGTGTTYKSRESKPARDGKPEGPRPARPRYPDIPDDITGEEIDRRVAAELRTLPEGLAEQVARFLVATSYFLEEDPERALMYAREAKRKAGRVSVVREALGLAAYATGEYAEALAELRAVRRMTGSDDDLAIMADCERGLDRPRKALELLTSVPEESMDPAARIECRIVAAGARRDLGQPEAALVLLQIPALNSRKKEPWLARLRYAYADTLAVLGRTDEAKMWFSRAMAVDEDEETDAADRLAELEGVTFGDDWSEDDEDVPVSE